METIKQIAEDLGVSKQSVQKRIAREPLCTEISQYVSIQGRTKYISDEGVYMIKSAFEHRTSPAPADSLDRSSIDDGKDIHALISLLQEESEAKNALIKDLQHSIAELTTALSASQALHAGTLQIILQ